jgi:hypothetical protein
MAQYCRRLSIINKIVSMKSHPRHDEILGDHETVSVGIVANHNASVKQNEPIRTSHRRKKFQ